MNVIQKFGPIMSTIATRLQVTRSRIADAARAAGRAPDSVRLVAVPAPIVEIQPAWRGYEYFMVGDQIVIVDPDTMQIVAIISA